MANLPIPGIDRIVYRDQWEEPGYEINNATYTPPRQNWPLIRFGMAHYTAASNLPDGDPGETLQDVINFIRRTQRWYLSHHGYSLGYLHAVDWTGRAIELRGFDYRAAANNGDKGQWADINLNRITAPVLYIVDGQSPLTDAMAATGRNLYAEYQRRTLKAGGTSWSQPSPKPHSETDFTTCCGDGIRADIVAGRLNLNDASSMQTVPLPPPVVPPFIDPKADDDMKLVHQQLARTVMDPGVARHFEHPALEGARAAQFNITVTQMTAPGYISIRTSPVDWSDDVSAVAWTGSSGRETASPILFIEPSGKLIIGHNSEGDSPGPVTVDIDIMAVWY